MTFFRGIKKFLATLLLAAVASGTVFARDEFAAPLTEIPRLVVTADLFERDARASPHAVEVVTREDIRRKGARTVAEALHDVAGLSVSSLGSPGEDLDLRLRGSDRDEVLVLLDGVPLNGVTDARATVLASLPADFVERIEIVRGAQSVIYGGGASGGVIAIITRGAGKPPRYGVAVEGGNLEYMKESASFARRFGVHGLSAGFSRLDQGGRFVNDRHAGNAFFLAYDFMPSEVFELKLNAAWLNQNQELAYGSAVSFANFPRVDYYVTRDFDRSLSRILATPRIEVSVKPLTWFEVVTSYSLALEDLELDNSNNGETPPIPAAVPDTQDFDGLSHRHLFDLRHVFTPAPLGSWKFRFTAGAAAELEFLKYTDAPYPGDATAETAVTFPDASLGQKGSRRNLAGYGLADVALAERLTLSLGLRYDDNSTYGTALSPRFSAGYFIPATGTRLHAGYSRGFYAPTINQYYLAVIGGTLTRRLSKEVSQGVEAGVRQDFLEGKVELDSTFFYTDYDSFINEVELVNDAHVIGVETSLRARPLSWMGLAARYTLMNAENDGNGTALSYRPEHAVGGEASFTPLDGWDILLAARYTGRQTIPDVLSTQALGDLELALFDEAKTRAGTYLFALYGLDIASRYRHRIGSPWLKELVYSVKASGLLNSDLSEPEEKFGYPMPRFRVVAGVEARF